jgi:DNA-directed RNA polymerase I subunit RPA2
MLSVVASLTPYSDYNQSPRNMYQCQMGKQTMGTPLQALPHRTDTKLYRIQTPQTPIARTDKYDEYHMDEFPNGTNAVVGGGAGGLWRGWAGRWCRWAVAACWRELSCRGAG